MREQCYLGVDLGAESGRVMAGLWNGKRMRLKELHRFPNGPVEIGGTLRWDVLRLWSEIQHGLQIAARDHAKSVKSVGVDTWGVDFVLLSKSNELLGQPHHYRDARTRGMFEKAFKRVSREEIFAVTGIQFMELNTLYQLLALQANNPEILACADCLLMVPDFFHWCLSGTRVAEFTDSTTTQLVDAKQRDWSRPLLKRFKLPPGIFPHIVPPGSKLGGLRPEVRSRLGLGEIEVIAPASHDTGSAVAAVPAQQNGGNWAYLSSGTWSLMGLELKRPQLSPDVLARNLTNEGGVDGTYRLLKNISGLWLLQQCRRRFEAQGKKRDYAELVRLAKNSAPLRSLIDPDDSRYMNPPDMVEAIQQACGDGGEPVPASEGAITRCVLESLALKYATVLESLQEVGGKRVEVIHIVGGGSRNALLNQFTADACNCQVIAGPVEATVLGNVLLQARAFSEVTSLSDIRRVVGHSSDLQTFEPNPRQAVAWAEARERFANLTSMDKPAGQQRRPRPIRKR